MPVSRRAFLQRGAATIVAAPAAIAGLEKGLGDGTAATNKGTTRLAPVEPAFTTLAPLLSYAGVVASVYPYEGTFSASMPYFVAATLGAHNRPPHQSRRRVQLRRIAAGSPPQNMPVVAGFDFTDGQNVPDNYQQFSSATYSLGSPDLAGAVQYAVMLFSLASPGIPDGLRRVAILPEM